MEGNTTLRGPKETPEGDKEAEAGGGGEGNSEDPAENPEKTLPLSLALLKPEAGPLYVPNVAFEPRITFFRNFPRIGAYFGAAAEAFGSPLAVLAVDTLAPAGSGLPLPEQDTCAPPPVYHRERWKSRELRSGPRGRGGRGGQRGPAMRRCGTAVQLIGGL